MSNKQKDDKLIDITDHKQLTSIYKKNGSFDNRRKQLLENFKSSQTHNNLLLKLKLMVESKIKNDPSILLKNKGTMGALIQGEVLNNNSTGNSILSVVDKDIQEKIIDSPEFHETLKSELKDTRRKCMGISDEDYAKQLEEEEKQKKEDELKREREQAERDVAYKNNFKVKQLAYAPKVVKPPRFNFQPKNARDRPQDGYGRGGAGGLPGHLMY